MAIRLQFYKYGRNSTLLSLLQAIVRARARVKKLLVTLYSSIVHAYMFFSKKTKVAVLEFRQKIYKLGKSLKLKVESYTS